MYGESHTDMGIPKMVRQNEVPMSSLKEGEEAGVWGFKGRNAPHEAVKKADVR